MTQRELVAYVLQTCGGIIILIAITLSGWALNSTHANAVEIEGVKVSNEAQKDRLTEQLLLIRNDLQEIKEELKRNGPNH